MIPITNLYEAGTYHESRPFGAAARIRIRFLRQSSHAHQWILLTYSLFAD